MTTIPDSVSLPCASRALDTSPSKSPSKRLSRQAAAEASSQDDVSHNKPSDQETAFTGMQQMSQQNAPAKPNKYIQLLNAAYPLSKSKLPTSTGTPAAAPATTASTPPGKGLLGSTGRAFRTSTPDKLAAAALRASGSGSSSPGTKVTPLARGSRSRASILDSSPGGSMMPASPASAAAIPSARQTAQSAAARSSYSPSLARRSMPAAADTKPQYAFGTRIDANSVRKPSPMRQSASSTIPQRGSISPQRVPPAAKRVQAVQAAQPARSASAPRMAAADKGQSRFVVHQANAIAEQRSKTPNPALRAKAVAASPTAHGRVKAAAASLGAAAAKHIARLRSSQDQNTTKVADTSIISSASPVTRPAARSMPARAASPHGNAGVGNNSCSSLLNKLDVSAGPRVPSYTPARTSGKGTSPGSRLLSTSPAGTPTIRDRYKSGYQHTPAAVAVEEARAAANNAAAGPHTSPTLSTVPRLSLGALLSSTESPALLRTRNREESPTLPLASQPRQQPQAAIAGSQLCSEGSEQTEVHYLGRFGAASIAVAAQQQSAASSVSLPRVPVLETATAAAEQHSEAGDGSPPLLQRKLSRSLEEEKSHDALQGEVSQGGLSSCSKQLDNQASLPCLSKETSSLSIDSAVAVAAKGLVFPLQRLQDAEEEAASPPKHRRGATGSPKGAAAVCSQLLKSRASSICGASNAAAESAVDGTSTAAASSSPAQLPQACMKPSPDMDSKHDLAARGSDTAAVPSRLPGLICRSLEGGMESTDRPDRLLVQRQSAAGPVTPMSAVRVLGAPSSASKPSTAGSPGDKMRMMVPKLDLTPVLLQLEEDDQSPQDQQQTAGQPLALEYHEDVQCVTDDQLTEPQESYDSRMPGSNGMSDMSGSGAKRGSSGSARGGARGGGSSRKASTPEQQSAPQESFYVYEAVMPAEETRTYEELRRALLKCPGGHKLAANLQGLWGCYQDARRNTEAMAFRGHRLLDQVSNEYCAYKRHAEEQLVVLQQECEVYKGELQLALTAGGQTDHTQLAAKEQQVRDLQQENEHLRLQLVEMEKAMQQAADYHFSQQADQVPVKARTIAESATTSILFQQTMAQQEELLKHKRELEDMKAALVIACGALKETNYMDPNGPVRSTLQPDTIQVLDMMIQSTAAEASMHVMSQSPMAAAEAESPHVHIEELHDTA